MSPAHVPVLLDEALDALRIDPNGIYVDATFGRGGHSRAILQRLGPHGRLLALDRDPTAVAAAADIADPRFSIVHAPFSHLGRVLDEHGITHIDGLLLDVGVSSPQIDDAQRGFSFRQDGPLDMRMDPTRGPSAAQWLEEVDEDELAHIIRKYGEERFAKQVARAIVTARQTGPLTGTRQLAQVVAAAVRKREPGQDPATRTFQAVRIHINRELEELEAALGQGLQHLAARGRLVAIAFHSLEDRLVKHFIRRHSTVPDDLARLPLREDQLPPRPLAAVGRAIKPSAAEVAANPRARSAVMRAAERTEGALA
ncbi:MAG: 16S rRNA (cytosine(1402)-N(4))-methyltransferase RsmH [Burkholderiales bacterium]|nr:16S rRNA (cytosine(1402)-N(4))-methyltransferase RsmH [Burkholderiales bacterium]